MKKKIYIFLVGIVVIAALALFVVPQIPVRKFEPVTHTMLEEDEAYERAYNLYGKVIFKDRRKALDKFKTDYKSALEYIEDNTDYGKFNTSYKTLSEYFLYGLNGLKNRDVDNADVLNKQLHGVAVFVKHIGKATIGNMYICLKVILLIARVHGSFSYVPDG